MYFVYKRICEYFKTLVSGKVGLQVGFTIAIPCLSILHLHEIIFFAEFINNLSFNRPNIVLK